MVERTSDKFVLIEGVVVNYGDKFCNIICSIMDEWYITSCVFTLKKNDNKVLSVKGCRE